MTLLQGLWLSSPLFILVVPNVFAIGEQSYPLSLAPRPDPPFLSRAYLSTLAHYQQRSVVDVYIGDSDDDDSGSSQGLRPYTWDSQYLIELHVGTPPQTLELVLDTGSSDLWVFSPQVPEWQQGGHNQYDPSLSSSAILLPNQTWVVRYGDGSSSNGNVFTDVVSIADIASPVQAVEAAQNVSIHFYGNPRADGIIGFGFSERNKVRPDKQTSWFDNIKDTLPNALFTLDLRHESYSSIDFGFINETKYEGEISYLPISVTNQGAWGFNATGFSIGSQDPIAINVNAIADSGTSLLIIDDAILEGFYGAIPGSRFNLTERLWIFPCDSVVPEFTVHLGDGSVPIPPSYLNFGPTDYNTSMCYGSLESNAGLNLSIFGITFLKSLFVIFDDDKRRLGFARKPLIH